MLKVKKLDPNAILPTKAHVGDLGYDLYALENVVIYPHGITLVRTGIACEFPVGYGALLRDRSSIAILGTAIVAGVIDNGYTGEILIAMHQIGKLSYHISKEQKIAQMILIRTVEFTVVEVAEVLSSDMRGAGGFGSTNANCMCAWSTDDFGIMRRTIKCLHCEKTENSTSSVGRSHIFTRFTTPK